MDQYTFLLNENISILGSILAKFFYWLKYLFNSFISAVLTLTDHNVFSFLGSLLTKKYQTSHFLLCITNSGPLFMYSEFYQIYLNFYMFITTNFGLPKINFVFNIHKNKIQTKNLFLKGRKKRR